MEANSHRRRIKHSAASTSVCSRCSCATRSVWLRFDPAIFQRLFRPLLASCAALHLFLFTRPSNAAQQLSFSCALALPACSLLFLQYDATILARMVYMCFVRQQHGTKAEFAIRSPIVLSSFQLKTDGEQQRLYASTAQEHKVCDSKLGLLGFLGSNPCQKSLETH